ncbi:MAG TPA: gliding motility-associated C-terminal domain-containing protein [Chitinophagales bacterium]|nr:gliding motility-associated C-terminal domain-containing protein [Chitinophagales bacterium]
MTLIVRLIEKLKALPSFHYNRLTSYVLRLTSLIILITSALSNSSAQTQIGGVINTYWPVTSFDMCNNRVGLPMIAVGINIGDKVLLMQMQGADIDTSDSPSYGTVSNYNGAGNYELLTVLDVTNNIITFQEILLRSYDVAHGVQLILVPQYVDVNIAAPVTAQPWDGATGGVVAFIASGTVTLNADIDVTGLGFRGAAVFNDGFCFAGGLGFDGYLSTLLLSGGANKGEGIAGTLYQNLGRGAPANGGGGGNDSNTGGGGGSNGAAGGQGGQRINVTAGCNGDNPGIGGYALSYSNAANLIFAGGGGGAGDDNSNGATEGANGGGIIFIRANSIVGNNFNILARGADVTSTLASYDGAGGGGGGGTVLLDVTNVSAVTISVNGGLGGSVDNGSSGSDSCFGPGGGGGAGMIWVSGGTLPPVTLETTGGNSGITTGLACSGTTNGALAGSNSTPSTGLVIPESTTIFVPLTLQVSNDTTVCANTAAFLSCTATGTGPLTYTWSNGATTDTTTVYPSQQTTYEVTVVDSRGCSLTKTIDIDVMTNSVTVTAVPDSIVKGWEPVQLLADTTGNQFFSWDPPLYLSDDLIYNPVATPPDTITYCVTATGYNGCIDTACVIVYVVVPPPAIFIPTAITPNGDGVNDTWHIIINNPCYTIEEMRVWNRWGIQIYDFHVSPGEFSGSYNGAPQAMEVYLYYIKAHCNTKMDDKGLPLEEEYVGNVTVIR